MALPIDMRWASDIEKMKWLQRLEDMCRTSLKRVLKSEQEAADAVRRKELERDR